MVDPFKQMEEIGKKMDKLFSSFDISVSPKTDIYEKGEEIIIKMDMPGINKDEINLAVTPNTIEVSAEHNEKKEEANKKYLRKERTSRSYSQFLELPAEIDPDSVEAKYENGVLTIKAKKSEKNKKKVKVE